MSVGFRLFLIFVLIGVISVGVAAVVPDQREMLCHRASMDVLDQAKSYDERLKILISIRDKCRNV